MTAHFKSAVLSQNEIDSLKELYEILPKKFYRRDHNLFNLYKSTVPPQLPKDHVEYMRNLINKLKNECGGTDIKANYFLKYTEASFTNIHFDSPERVNKTAVTLVDVSPDLIGGEAIILQDIHEEDLLPGEEIPKAYFSSKDKKPEKTLKIPLVLKQQIGETLFYDNHVHHGVTRVEQGYRLVLITWFG